MKYLLPLLALSSSALAQQDARYVRIELPGKGTLTLAEVEVMSGGKNLARKGKATQSTTASSGAASRAIDGNKNPDYTKGGQTHTAEGKRSPWWEVDLGKSVSVDSIQIWNRSEGDLGKRLEGFKLSLMDAKRRPVFVSNETSAPDSSVMFDFKKGGEVAFMKGDGKVVKQMTVPSDYRDPARFSFKKGDTVAIVGNGLADRMQHDGWTETLIQSAAPGMELKFRNMSLTGDRPGKYPRSKGFTPMPQYLQQVGADVIVAMFGYNESFDTKPEDHERNLTKMIAEFRKAMPNGESFPRIVLCSPIGHENLRDSNLPTGRANNQRLLAITEATRIAADKNGVTFVDLYHPSIQLYGTAKSPLTINGIHLNRDGNRMIGEVLAKALLQKEITASPSQQPLRDTVLDKNWHWHNRYRATDGNDVWGGRSGLKFVDNQTNATVLQHELKMLDVMTSNRDPAIWAVAQGRTLKVDDSNTPAAIPVISNVGGGSKSSNKQKEGNLKYLSGKEGLDKMHVPDGFKVNLFADEEMFPEMANPVQLQVDTKGRVWAAAWATYPKWEPLKKMNDALLIFEDTDNDGKADKVKEFAKVHNPLGFEFWNGGVIVTSQPDIIFLKDTDGDDVADVRYVIMQGIGSSDTHHAANNLIFGPDGGIYWQSGIFLQANHETPWGPSLSTGTSAMYRFDPRRYTVSLVAGNRPNPHGTSFDQWGYLYANDGTGGRSYQVRPNGNGFKMFPLLKKEVRPVSADSIVSGTNFPDEMQQNFLVCNTISFLGIKNYKLHRDGFEGNKSKLGEVWGTPEVELLRSDDGNFRPTDCVFGADGALYIADWHNVIIGHMQHNVRDPNRDKKHGRIYRMVYEDRPLQKPVKIDGVSISQLLENFKHPDMYVRHRTRIEISERDTDAVVKATQEWVKQFDPAKAKDGIPMLEALWVHQQHNVRNTDLLELVLKSADPHVVKGAETVRHWWGPADPANGKQELEEEVKMKITPGGVMSNTTELLTVRVNAIVEKIQYDVKAFEVKAGKKVKVIFVNPDFMPHNFVITRPGKADLVEAAAMALGADGFKMEFLPATPDILHATKLLGEGETEELEFTAPTEPGVYNFICTFPGHAKRMRGTMTVK